MLKPVYSDVYRGRGKNERERRGKVRLVTGGNGIWVNEGRPFPRDGAEGGRGGTLKLVGIARCYLANAESSPRQRN